MIPNNLETAGAGLARVDERERERDPERERPLSGLTDENEDQSVP